MLKFLRLGERNRYRFLFRDPYQRGHKGYFVCNKGCQSAAVCEERKNTKRKKGEDRKEGGRGTDGPMRGTIQNVSFFGTSHEKPSRPK